MLLEGFGMGLTDEEGKLGTVGPAHVGPGRVPLQVRELVTQHEDLDVLWTDRTGRAVPAHEPNEDQIEESKSHKPDAEGLTVIVSGQHETLAHNLWPSFGTDKPKCLHPRPTVDR